MSRNGLTRRHRRNINCLLGLQFSRTPYTLPLARTVCQGITNGLSAAPTHIARIIYADGSSERLAQQLEDDAAENGLCPCSEPAILLQAFRHTPCRGKNGAQIKGLDERQRVRRTPSTGMAATRANGSCVSLSAVRPLAFYSSLHLDT